MHCFVIVTGGTNPLTKKVIQSNFREHNYEIVPERAWIVASELSTCADVCEKIGLNGKTKRTGVVVKADEYNGWFARSLWEKANEWQGA